MTTVEADRALAGLEVYERIVVAVSGGADSTALMHLLVAWAQRRELSLRRIHVATVDHSLRAGSADEAAAVAIVAAALGCSHTTQTYDGPLPATPFSQSWARDLRYRLLVEAAHAALTGCGRAALLTAHHQDDQAETLLIRLARGSGIDGLAGIRRVRRLDDWVDLVRPLLGFGSERLRATLQARAVNWFDDPSNTNQRFERIRLRSHAPAREVLGLTSPALALSAARAGRASAALNTVTDRFLAGPAVDVHPLGFVRLDWTALLAEPEDIRVRALACIVASVGGQGPVPLGSFEAFTVDAGWVSPVAKTFGHCSFLGGLDAWLDIVREPGRGPPARRPVISGDAFNWDGRFMLRLGEGVPDGVDIRWLMADGLAQALAMGGVAASVPKAVLLTSPSLWCDQTLISAPAIGVKAALLRVSPFALPSLAAQP